MHVRAYSVPPSLPARKHAFELAFTITSCYRRKVQYLSVATMLECMHAQLRRGSRAPGAQAYGASMPLQRCGPALTNPRVPAEPCHVAMAWPIAGTAVVRGSVEMRYGASRAVGPSPREARPEDARRCSSSSSWPRPLAVWAVSNKSDLTKP